MSEVRTQQEEAAIADAMGAFGAAEALREAIHEMARHQASKAQTRRIFNILLEQVYEEHAAQIAAFVPEKVLGPNDCPRCNGTGDSGGNHERNWIRCTHCNGSGEITGGE